MKPALLLLLMMMVTQAADRVALVIGNDDYQHARPLKAAANDAGAVAEALKRLGFETIAVSNAGLEQMVEATESLKRKAAGAAAVLVYYAGHGIESQGINYLLPVDAKLEKEVQLQTQAVSLNSVLDKLSALKVPARMVILDCCRDNPLEGRTWLATRSAGGGGLGDLPVQNLPAATLVVYAASPGKPALDRVGPTDSHSPFTQALLEVLPQPGVHSFEVFGRVEESVLQRTEGRQSPRIFYNGSTLPFRNFQFAAAPSQSSAVPMVAYQPPAAPAPAAAVPPEPAASLPQLPASGYFDLAGLFAGGTYATHNDYSKTQILKKVQTKLKTEGVYSGSADGLPGPGTQRSLMTYQQAHELALTGRLDLPTAQALGLSGISETWKPKPAAPSQQRPTPAQSQPRSSPSRSVPQAPRSIDDILFGQ